MKVSKNIVRINLCTAGHRRIPLLLPALAMLAFSSMFYPSEDAWSTELYWDCVQEAPLTSGATNHKRSIGVDTFKRGRSEGKLKIRCIDTADEVTYRNFYTSPGPWYGATALENNGGTIESDGVITYTLRKDGASYFDAERVRWAVERGSVAASGSEFHGTNAKADMPKEYVMDDCTNAANSGRCYRLATEADLAELTTEELSEKVFWRLMDIEEKDDGDRKSGLAATPAGKLTNTEYLVEENGDNFIQSKYIYRDLISENPNRYRFVTEADGRLFVGDSIQLNPNGLLDFELEIKDIGEDGSTSPARNPKLVHRGPGGWPESGDSIVDVNPGGYFESVTVKMVNSRIKAGYQGQNDRGLVGIHVGQPEQGWKGPVTVDLSGSHIETWVSRRDGKYARGIRISMGAENNNVATVRLRDGSEIEVVNTSGHCSGANPPANTRNDCGATRRTLGARTAARLHTAGAQSPGVFVEYPRGGGSVRVNTPLEIRTNGENSPGIRAEFAPDLDQLEKITKQVDGWNGINWHNAIWSVYAAGDTNKARLWDGNTYMASTGLTLKHMEMFYRWGITRGGCLGSGKSVSDADCSSGDSDYVDEVPAPTQVLSSTASYLTQLNAAGKTPFDSPDDGYGPGTGPMARLQLQLPDRYDNRIAIADALKMIRESDGGVDSWNRFRQELGEAGTNSYAVFVATDNHNAGIVYEVGSDTKLYTSGDRSTGIGAFVNVPRAETKDIQTFVRIGDGSDFSGRGTQGETRFIVDKPITTTATTGSGSHGVVIISTGVVTGVEAAADPSLTADVIPSATHPLYGRDWDIDTPRQNIQIDVRSDIKVAADNNYGIALMSAEGTTSRVTVSPGVIVGQQTNDGGAMLFWKAADTVVNFGTTRGTIDFHAGNDRLVLRGGGRVTGVLGTDMLDFGAGEDTLELRSGTISLGVMNLETMMKSGAGDATVSAVTFTADRTANTMEVRDGRLIVKGHVNVGSGTVTVMNGAELLIQATGSDAVNTRLGRITATGGINFEGKATSDMLVSILTTVDGTAAADLTYAKANWLGTGTKVMASGSEVTTLGDGNYKQLTELVEKTVLVVARGERIDVPIAYTTGSQEAKVQGVVAGAINLGAGDDTLEVDGGVVFGAVDMGDDGAEGDMITLRTGEIRGAVTNVASMEKVGSGIATVGDVSFSSSTLMIKGGQLFIRGHVNLGTDDGDVVTVESAGRIVIVATGASAGEPQGRITANRIEFKGASPSIQILASIAATREADLATARASWLGAGTELRRADGTEIAPADLDYQPLSVDPRVTRGGGAGSSDSDSSGFYAAGALAVLWLVLRDDFCCELVDYESGVSGATFAGVKGAGQYRSGGVQTWAKMYSDSEVSAMQGLAVGMDARIGEHGYFGVSAMPSSTGSADTTGLSLNRRTSFEGGRYEGRGGWQKDSLFAGVRLSYGDYRASTSFKNVFEAGGQMSGSFDLVHTHLELGAGMQLDAGGQATVTPSLGVYGGSLSQGGSSASNAVLVADVPGYRQTYQGWRAGVQLKASDWLSWSDEIKARPQVGLSMYRTRTSGPGKLAMNQRDRLGVLNFQNALPIRGLPQNINAFRAGVALKKQGSLNMNLNYVGYEADGKFYHGAVARVSIGF